MEANITVLCFYRSPNQTREELEETIEFFKKIPDDAIIVWDLKYQVEVSQNFSKNFVFKDQKLLIFSHYLGKIAGLRPAIFSGTSGNSENQILSIINSKKWPETPQKHQKNPKKHHVEIIVLA